MRMLPVVQAVKISFVQSMDIRPWMGKLSDWRAKNSFEIGKEQKGNYLYFEAQFVSDTRGEESPSRRGFFFSFFVKFTSICNPLSYDRLSRRGFGRWASSSSMQGKAVAFCFALHRAYRAAETRVAILRFPNAEQDQV